MNKNAMFHRFVSFTTAVHEVKHAFTRDIKMDGITPVQYDMLEYIAVSQPVSLSEISDCLHMSMPNTSRELRKLIEKDLCEKFTAADDKRKQMVRLSGQGQKIMDEAFGKIEARFLERIDGLSDEELEEIGSALTLLQTKVYGN